MVVPCWFTLWTSSRFLHHYILLISIEIFLISCDTNPRKHIWTYANGVNLMYYPLSRQYNCPCNSNTFYNAPSFVGSDYYCETGDHDYSCCDYEYLFSNDTLWDGQQCPGVEAPCCTHPNMPWFNKTLNETTAEDIELRVCADQSVANEDTPLQVIELFVR